MKCCICGTELNSGVIECPCCRFVDPRNGRILGDAAAIAAQVEKEAVAFRARFFDGIEVGILTYSWKDENGVLVQEGVTRRPFGKLSALTDGCIWMNRKFARVPGEQTIPVTLYVNRSGDEKQIPVQLEALPQAELLEVGVSLDADWKLRVHLRNTSAETSSQPITIMG